MDFRRPSKFNRDQLRTLEMLHDTFARLGGTYLSGALRGRRRHLGAGRRAGHLRRVHLVAARAGLHGILELEPLETNAILALRPAARLHDDRPPAGRHRATGAGRLRELTDIELSLSRTIINAPAGRAVDLVVGARRRRLHAAPHGDEPAVRADRAADRAVGAAVVPDPRARVDRRDGAVPAVALDRARRPQPDRELVLLRASAPARPASTCCQPASSDIAIERARRGRRGRPDDRRRAVAAARRRHPPRRPDRARAFALLAGDTPTYRVLPGLATAASWPCRCTTASRAPRRRPSVADEARRAAAGGGAVSRARGRRALGRARRPTRAPSVLGTLLGAEGSFDGVDVARTPPRLPWDALEFPLRVRRGRVHRAASRARTCSCCSPTRRACWPQPMMGLMPSDETGELSEIELSAVSEAMNQMMGDGLDGDGRGDRRADRHRAADDRHASARRETAEALGEARFTARFTLRVGPLEAHGRAARAAGVRGDRWRRRSAGRRRDARGAAPTRRARRRPAESDADETLDAGRGRAHGRASRPRAPPQVLSTLIGERGDGHDAGDRRASPRTRSGALTLPAA